MRTQLGVKFCANVQDAATRFCRGAKYNNGSNGNDLTGRLSKERTALSGVIGGLESSWMESLTIISAPMLQPQHDDAGANRQSRCRV